MVICKAKLTSKGRLTLPEAVRKALQVGQGDLVTFEIWALDNRLRILDAGYANFAGAMTSLNLKSDEAER